MSHELLPGQQLSVGESIQSANGAYRLVMQADGNLVLYRNHDGRALWHTWTWGKPVSHVIMQADGNLVVYTPEGGHTWDSHTWGNPGAKLVLQDDGDLVIYQGGKDIWGSGSNDLGPCPAGCIDKRIQGGKWEQLEFSINCNCIACFSRPVGALVRTSHWIYHDADHKLNGTDYVRLTVETGFVEIFYHRAINVRYYWSAMSGKPTVSFPPIKF